GAHCPALGHGSRPVEQQEPARLPRKVFDISGAHMRVASIHEQGATPRSEPGHSVKGRHHAVKPKHGSVRIGSETRAGSAIAYRTSMTRALLACDERGANYAEYIIAIAVVALVVLAGARAFGLAVDAKIRCYASAIAGSGASCAAAKNGSDVAAPG